MCRSTGTRDIKCKENIFMMLGTFNFITIPGAEGRIFPKLIEGGGGG